MHRPLHKASSRKAALLLGLFVLGGLLGPALHQVEHGRVWAELRGDSCDHAQHGDVLEPALPIFQGDQCLLCVRPVLARAALPVVLARLLGEGVRSADGLAVRASHNSDLRPIRGPPILG